MRALSYARRDARRCRIRRNIGVLAGGKPRLQRFPPGCIEDLGMRQQQCVAQRIADANQKLPRQPAHAGTFTSAKGDKRETVADVNRRLRATFAR